MSLAFFYPGRDVRCDLCREWSPADQWELVADETEARQ